MTKAVICKACSDIVSPNPKWLEDRSWRWCACLHVATRWRDGSTGQIEVVSLHGPNDLRVIGLNNAVIEYAFAKPPTMSDQWRELHRLQGEMVEPYYLFHKDKRDCWALLVRPGESSDVHVVDYAEAWAERNGGVS
ncbi:MAG TPA: hypothetical protein VFH56_06665 [Acidimicrobiales bacterium]|nr:hypothetical protein [Acidimicrobiales bacterium]